MADYKVLKSHYEKCLEQHGANAKGMDWPNAEDLDRRFAVLTGIIDLNEANQKTKLLDLGCGVGLLVDYFKNQRVLDHFEYTGIDISGLMINEARKRYPELHFEIRDVLEHRLGTNSFDYVIMNGLFTEKREMSQPQMFGFFKKMVVQAFNASKKGISFNVMSSHVDWKRDDLFHLELDKLVSFLVKNCSRHITIRMDYGLYEYSVYVRK